MTTECKQVGFEFHPLKQRQIRVQFDGGAITSDGGGRLLREVEKRTGVLRQFAACFSDYRDPERIEHTVQELVAQRVYGLALGYEDLNDHDQLRKDPLLAVLVEKSDPGQDVLAGKSTLNRLELTRSGTRKSYWTMGRWIACWWICFCRRTGKYRSKSFWTWMRPMIRCTASRKGGSFTVTTDTTAICRCTFFAESSCCVHGCGHRTSTERRAAWRSCSASCSRFARPGRRCASWCAGTRGSAARN